MGGQTGALCSPSLSGDEKGIKLGAGCWRVKQGLSLSIGRSPLEVDPASTGLRDSATGVNADAWGAASLRVMVIRHHHPSTVRQLMRVPR